MRLLIGKYAKSGITAAVLMLVCIAGVTLFWSDVRAAIEHHETQAEMCRSRA